MILQKKAQGHAMHFIEEIWYVKESDLSKEKQKDIIIPSGRLHVVYNMWEPYYWVQEDEEKKRLPDIALVGQMKKPEYIEYSKNLWQVGIVIKPLGFYSLSGSHVGGFKTLIQDAQSIRLLNDVQKMIRRVVSKETIDDEAIVEQIYHRIEQYLVGKLWDDPVLTMLEGVIQTIEDRKGLVTISEVASQVGYSLNGLERKFKKYMGMTLKQYADIIKLKQAYSKMDALDYFYDQPHYIKTMKKYTFMSPKALEASKKISLKKMLKEED